MGDMGMNARDVVRDRLTKMNAWPSGAVDDRITDFFAAELVLSEVEVNGFTVGVMDRFPAGEHPGTCDLYHQYEYVEPAGVTVLHSSGEQFHTPYAILAHRESGRRLKVTLPGDLTTGADNGRGHLFNEVSRGIGLGGFLAGSTVFASAPGFVSSVWPEEHVCKRAAQDADGKFLYDEERNNRWEPWLSIRYNPAEPDSILLTDVRVGVGRSLMVLLPTERVKAILASQFR